MKLSLSVRVAESFTNKEKISVPFAQLIALARQYQMNAMCMRASVAGIQTPVEVVRDYRQQLNAAGLPVSMVTGDFAVPVNGDAGPDCLRWITPYLDLAREFNATLIRVCMKVEEDIYWAQRAADEAKERGIRLAHQSHCASMFESPENSLRVLKKVNRDNFGLIYEAANWFVARECYGPDAIEMIRPYLYNVYVQNHRLNPNGQAKLDTWKRGVVGVDHIGIWEKDGVNYDQVLSTLAKAGYSGYVTIHQAFAGVMPLEESIRRSVEYLRRF